MTFKKILCPVDFSEPSRAAMRAAIELAREAKGTVTLLHVLDATGFAAVPDGFVMTGFLEETARAAEQTLQAWKAEAVKLGAVDPSARLERGAAWHEIVEQARRDPSIELIVLGTHGRTGLTRALVGSVAEKVVRHAPVSVLVVRPPSKA